MYAGQRQYRLQPAGVVMSAPGTRPGGKTERRRCATCGTVLAFDNSARMCGRCTREQRDQLDAPISYDEEFFETEDFRAAFESRNMGRVFKVYRNHPRHLQIFGKALNQETLARWLNITQVHVSRIEIGRNVLREEDAIAFAQKLHIPQRFFWILYPGERWPSEYRPNLKRPDSSVSAAALHESLTDVLSPVLSSAGVDEWERRIVQFGKATRYRSAASLVPDLVDDIGTLRHLLTRSRSFELTRRLSRAMAQLSGLMSLTLLKLEDRSGSRNWVRTARILAAESGDIDLQSWVHAQEAYFHFYDRNLIGAIEAAQHAEAISKTPNVGAVLATALEARASAILGRKDEATSAADRAELYLERLDSGLIVPSAFGYDEAQLRFHQGSALTQLGETRAAFAAQDRALDLYPAENYLDRALVQLDRAQGLIQERDATSAIELAAATFSQLELTQARGMIAARIAEVIGLLSASAQSKPAVLDLKAAIEHVEIDR